MTTVQAAELLRTKVLGGAASDDASLQIQDFVYAINAASAYKKKGEYWELMKQTGENTVPDTWLETFVDLPVTYNETQGLYECVLPYEPLDIAKGRGIQLICPMQDPTNPFFPMAASENWMFSGLPATYTSYWITDSTLQFKNIDPKYTSLKAVYVPAFSGVIHDDMAHEIIEIAMNQFLKVKGILPDENNNSNPIVTNGNRQ